MSAYTLGRACWIVGNFDSSEGRQAVFADVVRRSVAIRSAYRLYDRVPAFIKPYLLLLYGLKCFLSVNWRAAGPSDIVCLAAMPNERTALGHVRRHIRGLRLGDISLAKANALRLQSLAALPRFLACARRLHRIARRLSRRYPFMPACRVFSTAAYYTRFRPLLDRCEARAVFIANHYSPECLALAAAAHRCGRKVLFTNHANATWRQGYLPPLYSDLAAVTSRAVLATYQKNSTAEIAAVFLSHASCQDPLRSAVPLGRTITVGVFLTALTNMERLQALLGLLAAQQRVERVLIRPHPVQLVNEDISHLCRPDGRIEDTGDTPLAENIGLCDLASCGNSTVTIELLRGGVPVFYDAQLDGLSFDYNGYLKGGLVPALPDAFDTAALQSLRGFYGAPDWVEAMRYFDAGYQQDEGTMIRRLNDAIQASVWGLEPLNDRSQSRGAAEDVPDAESTIRHTAMNASGGWFRRGERGHLGIWSPSSRKAARLARRSGPGGRLPRRNETKDVHKAR